MIAALQVALRRAVRAADLAEARCVNDRMFPIVQALYREPMLDMHNRMKETLVHLGRLEEAHVRPPLKKLPADEIASLAAVFTG